MTHSPYTPERRANRSCLRRVWLELEGTRKEHHSITGDETRVDCPSCSSRCARLFTQVEGHTLLRCKKCDLVFVSPRPTESQLTAHHVEYFAKPGSRESLMQINRRALFQDCLARIEARVPSGTVVDVGAAYGDFLRIARSHGYDVFGVEIAPEPCARMVEERIPCHLGDLQDAPISPDSVDITTFWDVLEHLPNLSSVLRSAHRILRTGGILAATVPNRRFQSVLIHAEGLVGRDSSSRWEVPSHLNHFSAGAIRKALRNSGFRVIDIRPAFPTPLRPGFANTTKRALYRVATAVNTLVRLNIGNELFVLAVADKDA